MMSPQKPNRIQKLCTLWTHGPDFSSEELVFNIDRFPELKLKPGSLAKIVPVLHGTSVRDFVHEATKRDNIKPSKRDAANSTHDEASSRKNLSSPSMAVTVDETGSYVMASRDTDEHKAYVFVVNDASPEMKQKHPQLHVSPPPIPASSFLAY
jgi:hypothetical protein